MSTATLMTADQLLRMPKDGYRHELIAGELRKMPPPGWEHGMVGGRLNARLSRHVLEHDSGEVFLAETGFLLTRDPDTVRAPDIAFIRKERFEHECSKKGYWQGPPDLAVEVLLPGDSYTEVSEKVQDWLDGGAAMVWGVDPKRRTVTVYRSESEIRVLREKDELLGEGVLPGFRCSVREIFDNG